MRWDQLDLAAGVWTKPGAATKQKTEHRVPLYAAGAAGARRRSRRKARGCSPARRERAPRWPSRARGRGSARPRGSSARTASRTVRVHDLRHTYASLLASAGLTLPIIGALLGHTQPQTTARYAHLLDDPLRAATERAGTIVAGR